MHSLNYRMFTSIQMERYDSKTCICFLCAHAVRYTALQRLARQIMKLSRTWVAVAAAFVVRTMVLQLSVSSLSIIVTLLHDFHASPPVQYHLTIPSLSPPYPVTIHHSIMPQSPTHHYYASITVSRHNHHLTTTTPTSQYHATITTSPLLRQHHSFMPQSPPGFISIISYQCTIEGRPGLPHSLCSKILGRLH
ncbi:hypothetical protein FHG87_016048 [Trinorchestia longiramus]|nr:hypothetical protein FHG87_016048 [Trinorchestia longiramus]